MSTTFRQQILDTRLLHKLQGRGVETILFNFSPKGEFQRADMVKDRYPNFETVTAGCPEGIVNRVAAALGEFVHEKAPVNSGAQLKMFLAEKRIEGAIHGANQEIRVEEGFRNVFGIPKGSREQTRQGGI